MARARQQIENERTILRRTVLTHGSERLGQLEHLQFGVVDAAGLGALINVGNLRLVRQHFHVAGRAFEELGQRLHLKCIARDADLAIRLCGRHRLGALVMEVTGREAIVGGERPGDAVSGLLFHGAEQRDEIARGQRDGEAGESRHNFSAILFARGVGGVPVRVLSSLVLAGLRVRRQRRRQPRHELRELLGERHRLAEPGEGRLHKADDTKHLVRLRHPRPDDARQAVHGVIPPRLAPFHFDTHAQRIQRGELEEPQDGELGNDGHGEHAAALRPLPDTTRAARVRHVVRVRVDGVERVRTLHWEVVVAPRCHCAVHADRATSERVTVRARLHDGGAHEKRHRFGVPQQLLLLVWKHGQVSIHEVQCVRPVLDKVLSVVW